MKKIFLIILVFVMLFSCIAGCDGLKPSQNTENNTEQQQTQEDENQRKVVSPIKDGGDFNSK